jgi:hypothetical protein
MSMSSNHNQIPFDKIEKYVSGAMTSVEKNTFEKEALDNPFLQDAIDGYSENPGGIEHFKIRLQKKGFNKNFKFIGVIALISLFYLGIVIYNKIFPAHHIAANNDIITQTDSVLTEVEIIPMELETLQVIQNAEVIKQNDLVKKFKDDPIFNPKNYESENTTEDPINKKIEIKKITETEEEEQILMPVKIKKVYPFVYFYDLAVVDYRRYENREQSIQKTTYSFSGVSADKESENSTNHSEMTEKVVKVTYMEYLEESMWYFSNAKYKNALKRFDVIAGQYKNDLNALFYGGLSNYNLGRFDIALLNFTTITSLSDNPFYEDALWYKAKTEIKLGEINAAKYDLQELIIEGGFYAEKAIILMKKL